MKKLSYVINSEIWKYLDNAFEENDTNDRIAVFYPNIKRDEGDDSNKKNMIFMTKRIKTILQILMEGILFVMIQKIKKEKNLNFKIQKLLNVQNIFVFIIKIIEKVK